MHLATNSGVRTAFYSKSIFLKNQRVKRQSWLRRYNIVPSRRNGVLERRIDILAAMWPGATHRDVTSTPRRNSGVYYSPTRSLRSPTRHHCDGPTWHYVALRRASMCMSQWRAGVGRGGLALLRAAALPAARGRDARYSSATPSPSRPSTRHTQRDGDAWR